MKHSFLIASHFQYHIIYKITFYIFLSIGFLLHLSIVGNGLQKYVITFKISRMPRNIKLFPFMTKLSNLEKKVVYDLKSKYTLKYHFKDPIIFIIEP